jgi:radical SAM superfamily enzyme YgiQ (UPF0313 family)
MKKKILVFSPNTTYIFTLPALLLNFQRHHEQFGRHPEDWEWCEPVLDFKFSTIKEFTDHVIDTRQPDVLCLGVYVWNEELCLELGRAVKEQLPNCKIVIGGPQISFLRDPTWFSRHTYIDYGCHVSGYGELFMTELLDQISEGHIDETKIPLMCKPTTDGFELLGPKTNPRDYVWPTNIYSKDDDRIPRWIADEKAKGASVAVLIEGTRGCPYTCTYCEWGGGIGTKINAKPTDQLIKELDVLTSMGVDKIFITDANFGILARDIEVTEKLVEFKRITKYPNNVDIMGPAKNNDDRVRQIDNLLLENGLMGNWTLNVQTLDTEILKNIKRTDTPWQDRLQPYLDTAKKYNLEVNMQMIYPLPGWSYKHFLEEIDHQAKYDVWGMVRFELQVLPNTEMADPKNLEKYGIKLKPVKMLSIPTIDTGVILEKDMLIADPARVEVIGTEYEKDLRNEYAGETHTVIYSNTITAKELTNIRYTIPLLKSLQQLGIFTDLVDWLSTQGIPHSDYYDKLVREWLWKDSSSHAKKNILQKLWLDIDNDWMGDSKVAWHRYIFPLYDFPFLLEPQHLFMYAWASDPELIADWSNWVYDTWGNQAGDLAELIRIRTINIEWDPIEGRTHTSGWDWRPWIDNREQPTTNPVTLTWKQRHFRGQLLPYFKHGDTATGKLWILRYMFPINRTTLIKHAWTLGNDDSYLALYSENYNKEILK